MDILNEITQSIRKELKEFDVIFRNSLRTKVGLLDTILLYLVQRKGKRIRPTIVFLSANLIGEINQRTFIGATMVELLHTATLIHDDVVDEADFRRGFATINSKWSNKIAVLLGDFLLAKGFLMSVEHKEYEFLQILSNTVKLMSEGELLQMQTAKENIVDESRYFDIIFGKTASFISSCTEIGAASVTDDIEIQRRMREFGKLLGYAFQIRDDIFDYIGNSSIIGKPIGNDIKERKITLPMIYALKNVHPNHANEIIRKVKSKSKKKDIREIIDFVIANKGIDFAQNTAFELVTKAKDLLKDFPNNQAKESLLKLADFIVERKN